MLRFTPGDPPKAAILPTAAGLEDVSSWIKDGIAHFSGLGCEAYGVWATNRAGWRTQTTPPRWLPPT